MYGGNHRYALVVAVALVAVTLVCTACATPEKRSVRKTACGRVSVTSGASAASLRVVGNQMVDAHGHPFVPSGISLVGGPENKYWAETEKAAMAQIVASQRFWHANAVRVQ